MIKLFKINNDNTSGEEGPITKIATSTSFIILIHKVNYLTICCFIMKK